MSVKSPKTDSFCFQGIIIRAYSLCLILLLKYIIIYYDKINFEKKQSRIANRFARQILCFLRK